MTTDENVMATDLTSTTSAPEGDVTAGKGKAAAAAGENLAKDEDMGDAMDDDDSDEEEEEPAAEEDGMEEIDPSNIIATGRRTRGRVIDFAKAAEENPPDVDEDEEDDDDFHAEDDRMDED
ncbi:hypothetical protein MKZ38_002028 [Zalerion maritima]|uniref:Histone chaperone domain-containing protein n=1 Tax=Zalerion maritima TaxID=339359 RepID=A0AAD5WTE8_9PEZI|nr:hypothetical protein MKZ38_002028 [Zalerion maritima]